MKYYFTALAALLMLAGTAQTSDHFTLTLEEITLDGAPAVQSFVSGQYNGKWLIIGGRTDGLHRRQPWASFGEADNNATACVIDPVANQTWSSDLSMLPSGLAEQLQSTNMQFEQRDSVLYVIGGYGYSATATDHITYANLTAINLPGAIDAVMTNGTLLPHFRQITDTRLKVTGGYLDRLGDVFYLAGGQLFDGRYNPMGPTHGPGFVQEYTEAIKRFEIVDDGQTLSISNYEAWTDSANLHRRDYNMTPQVFPDGAVGLTMFSGVFQHDVDLPWLNTVDVRDTGYAVRPNFNQYLNQYHTAHLPAFDAANGSMHTVFFGGMSRYTLDDADQLVDDPEVPFVTTISQVTRYANDSMAEFQVGDMPGLLGSGAEFIRVDNASYFDEYDILQLAALPETQTLVGYVIGGIESTQPNIFFVNDGTQSAASSRVFEVYVTRGALGVPKMVMDGNRFFRTKLFPNPAAAQASLQVSYPHETRVHIELSTLSGQKVKQLFRGRMQHKLLAIDTTRLTRGSYIISIHNEQYSKRVMLVVP